MQHEWIKRKDRDSLINIRDCTEIETGRGGYGDYSFYIKFCWKDSYFSTMYFKTEEERDKFMAYLRENINPLEIDTDHKQIKL
jgi:hypothetical protein